MTGQTLSIEMVRIAKKLESLQSKIGYQFGENVHFLRWAIEHSSMARREKGESSSETLEFLGDAVLYLVVTIKLSRDQPWQAEGVMTELRKNLIKNSTLVRVGERMGLRQEDLLLVGKSVKSGNGVTDKMVADGVEAIIGAIFMSEKYCLDAAEAFIDKWFFQSGIKDEVLYEIDSISRLKVWCDKQGIKWPKELPCERKDGIWYCRLVISEYDEIGEGANMAVAKRLAAIKILKKIESSAPS
jgi:dsRNA-specific ribonuclease